MRTSSVPAVSHPDTSTMKSSHPEITVLPTGQSWNRGVRSKGRRRGLWAVTIVALLLAGGSAAVTVARRPRLPSYVTASVARGGIEQTVEATGTISAVTTV